MAAEAIALILFLLPLAWSPGPGNLFFAALGARGGLRGSLRASLGYHAATWTVTLAIGLGFGALTGANEVPALIMAYLGAAYVLWMAWKFWRASAVRVAEHAPDATMRDGAVLLILNPKAYAIIAAMFAQFLTPDAGITQVLWITTLFTLNNLVAFTVWTWAGETLLHYWRRDVTAQRLNRGAALLLACVAIWIVMR